METFIARQPIFNQWQRVYGYELLFRSSLVNAFDHPDTDYASSKVIVDSYFLLGIENLTGGKKAFINVTRETLIRDYVELLPKEQVVVEILETVEPDAEVVAACRRLKQAGYLLSLDDFVYRDSYLPLLELVDNIKVDFLTTARKERADLVKRLKPLGISLIAEKVETPHAFREALEMGYDYFQGYFFCRPDILTGNDVPGIKLNYFRILQEIHRPELDYGEIEKIIKHDMSLSYKLLRFINSALFGRQSTVSSIKQAVALLGECEMKKWTSLVVLASLGEDKPAELVSRAIVRAKFCECLAESVNLAHRAEDLFLMGMFSLIDAILDRTLDDILRELPIAFDIKTALLGGENRLREVYETVLAYERGDWETLSRHTAGLGIDEAALPQLYTDAIVSAGTSMAAPAHTA